ncbi:hypothetical protein PR202_gb00654 [Eleusine coracana subsp. coracana]|uniref:F-box domain-containing protein n=1 Tax=Eleusine coracana subsp. coracana TaxID=191504 RepID=A0AAV5DUB1_ELECO|nr:hypothetical protein PR202_gb00654 [Eleusine coracana subsp. coracana]
MVHMECSSFPITKEKELACTSCENCNSKRKKSQSNSWRIKRRQLDIQSSIPSKINIQRLPEDIVPRITSKLTIRESAQVSVLSSMWRQACTFHPNLHFNIETVLGSHAKREGIHSCLGNEMPTTTINKFVERVDAILKNHCGTHVNKFAVEFGFSMEHANHINRWVLFATASKARILVLNFSANRTPYASNNYSFPFQLFNDQNGSYLQTLWLDSVALDPSPDFCGFANLRMLALVNACTFRSIEFHAPNLRTFDFEYRDSLALLNLNKSLKLKTATIRLNFFQLSYLLQAAPLLEDLHLKMSGLDPVFAVDLDDIMDLPHYHLKTVCITGFCGNGGEVELAKYILKNALILEHLIINPGGTLKGHTSTVDAWYGRKEAKEKLAPFDLDNVLTIL